MQTNGKSSQSVLLATVPGMAPEILINHFLTQNLTQHYNPPLIASLHQLRFIPLVSHQVLVEIVKLFDHLVSS